jgi:hypothetical protein
MKKGDILAYTWGYGQTNVDFYQVTRATAKSAWIRHIKQDTVETGFMCGHTSPRPGEFDDGGEKRKDIKSGAYGEYLSMDYGLAVPAKDKHHCSWYY